MDALESETFTFHAVPERTFAVRTDASVREHFAKWGLDRDMHMATFRFDQFFQRYLSDQLLKDFLNDKEVQKAFRPATGLGTVTSVRSKPLACTKMSFDFFDRLTGAGIVRGTGGIVQCMPEYVDDVCISDKLRQMLLVEDSENFTLYSDDERDEVLMRILRACVVGGALCQYEDNIEPYFAVTKALYKDLLSVRKNPETGKLEIVTQVYEIRNTRNDGTPFFSLKSGHEFCYVFVDPAKRHVTCWHNVWHNGFFGSS